MSGSDNENNSTINLVIADDSYIVIDCIQNWVRDEARIRLLGVACKHEELCSMIGLEERIVVLSTYQWILKQGKSIMQRLMADNPGMSLAICLNSVHYDSIHRLIDMGIKGFFGDLSGRKELVKGLCDIINYDYFMAPEILSEFITLRKAENGDHIHNKFPLTNREKEILDLVLAGKNSREIARKLNISKRTVDGHRANINNKFGVRNTAQLYRRAGSYLSML